MKSQPGSEEVRTSSFGSPDTGQKFETFFGGREFGLGWVGFDCGSKMHCTPSEDCSLASNLRAQQQGVAIQQSDSSE